jgi:hypothetical protein
LLKPLRLALLLAALLPLGSRAVGAQTLSVSGNPGLLRISAAIAGSQPTGVSDGATTYTVTTPPPNRTYKLTAQLSSAMPTGVTLTATFAAPTGATSLGAVALDGIARDVVTGIPRNTDATGSITYQFNAMVTAGVIPTSSQIVTITVVRTS